MAFCIHQEGDQAWRRIDHGIALCVVRGVYLYKIDCVDEEVVDMKHIPLKVVKKISVIFSVLGLLLVIIFTILFRRCPYCGGFLKVGFQNFYCPHCGNYIDGNK